MSNRASSLEDQDTSQEYTLQHVPFKLILSWNLAGHVVRMGEKRNAYTLLIGKPEGRRPLRRPRRRWLDNIRMDLAEVGWGDVDCVGLAQDWDRRRGLVNSLLNLRVP
jgi:hypothetical protein